MTIIANGSNNQFSKYRKFSKYGAANNYGDGISGIRTDGSVTMLDIVSNCDTAVAFDGTNDYLSLASSSDWDLGSGDFTIEFWAYFNDVTTAQKTLITRRNALSNYAPYYLGCNTSGRITFYASSNGSSYNVANNLTFGSLTTNRWYHIALVRNGSQFTGYIDGTGTSLLTSSATLYNNSQSLVVGAETDPNYEHDGFISNLRIVKGTALYTKDFNVPVLPLGSPSGTVLLTCTGDKIEDISDSNHSITVNNDCVVVNDGPIYKTYIAADDGLYKTISSENLGIQSPAIVSGKYFNFVDNVGGYIFAGTNVGDVYISSDGENWTDISDRLKKINATFWSPTQHVYSAAYGNGYYVISGYAKMAYSTDLVTWKNCAHFPDIYGGGTSQYRKVGLVAQQSGGTQYFYDINYHRETSKWYLCSRGNVFFTSDITDAGSWKQCTNSEFYGLFGEYQLPGLYSSIPGSYSTYGTTGAEIVGVASTVEPFGGAGAVEFDGTGDYLTAGSASDWAFLNADSAFTAECWFYSQSTSQQTLLSTAATQSAIGFILNLSDTSTSDIAAVIYKGSTGRLKAISSGSVWNTNTWNHVAVVYNTSTDILTIYLNGTSIATADGSSFAFNSSNPSNTLAIGRYQLASPGGYVDGYISNVRLVNGTALYTEDFTPIKYPDWYGGDISGTVLSTCRGDTIRDDSSSNHTITVVNDAVSVGGKNHLYTQRGQAGEAYFSYNTIGFSTSLNFDANNPLLMRWTEKYNPLAGKRNIKTLFDYAHFSDISRGPNDQYLVHGNYNAQNAQDRVAITTDFYNFDQLGGRAYGVDRGYTSAEYSGSQSDNTATFKNIDMAVSSAKYTKGGNTNYWQYHSSHSSAYKPGNNRWFVAYDNYYGYTNSYSVAGLSTNAGLSWKGVDYSVQKFPGYTGYVYAGLTADDYFIQSRNPVDYTGTFVEISQDGEEWYSSGWGDPSLSNSSHNSNNYLTYGKYFDGKYLNGYYDGRIAVTKNPQKRLDRVSIPINPNNSLEPNSLVLCLPLNEARTTSDICGIMTAYVGYGTNFTVTNNNSVSISSTISKYYGSSAQFNGTNQYLSIADHNDLDLGTGDFTIEFWVYANSLTDNDGLVGKRGSSTFNSNSWRIAYNSANSNINLQHSSLLNDTIADADAPSLNTWTHYAFARESGTIRVFKDGIKHSDASYTYDFSNTYSLLIGANANTSYTWHGHLQDVRIYKGYAKYTADFAPPKLADYFQYLNVSLPLNSKGTGDNGLGYNNASDLGGLISNTYAQTITGADGSDYTVSGSDRIGTVSGGDPTITVHTGDTITFDNTSYNSSHPLYIRVSDGGSSVSNPAATGEGTTSVSWTPSEAGTYYYQCSVHSGMIGSIVVLSTDVDVTPASSTQTVTSYAGVTTHLHNGDNVAIGNTQTVSNSVNLTGSASIHHTSYQSPAYGSLGSLRFPNSGTYQIESSPLGGVGTGDYTIEGYFATESTGAQYHLTHLAYGNGYCRDLIYSTSGYNWYYYSSSAGSSWNVASGISLGSGYRTWFHFAIERYNGRTYLYRDGVGITSFANTTNYTADAANTTYVSTYNGSQYPAYGNVQDLRMYTGAKYQGQDFTPPTSWVDISADSDTNVALAASFQGTNGQTTGIIHQLKQAPGLCKGITVATATTSLYVGDEDFTIEFYYYKNQSAGNTIQMMFDMRDGTDTSNRPLVYTAENYAGYTGYYLNGAIRIYGPNIGGASYADSAANNFDVDPRYDEEGRSNLNRWIHVAISRKNGLTRYYFDGHQAGTLYFDTSIHDSSKLVIGAYHNESSYPLTDAWIQDFQLYKGYAKYFPEGDGPENSPWIELYKNTATGRIYDNNYKNAWSSKAFLKKNVNGENKYVFNVGREVGIATDSFFDRLDESRSLVTDYFINNNVVGVGSTSAFGTGCIKLEGTNAPTNIYSSLGAPSMDDTAFGYEDFSVELWVNYINTSGTQMIWDCRPYSTNGWYPTLYTVNGVLYYYFNSANRITGSTLSAGQWYHIALSRTKGITRLFVDGTQVGSDYTNIERLMSGGFNLGRGYTTNNFYGYMNGLRVYRGYNGGYSSNFTPPTGPLSASGDSYQDKLVLLSNFNTDGTATGIDTTTIPAIPFQSWSRKTYAGSGIGTVTKKFLPVYQETTYANGPFGNVSVGSTYKYGSSSTYFDGNSGVKVFDPRSFGNVIGTNDFTIEFWLNLDSVTGTQYILESLGGGASGAHPEIYMSSSSLVYSNTSTTINATGLNTGQWYHVLIQRESGTTKLLLDGVEKTTMSDTLFYGQDYRNYSDYEYNMTNFGHSGYSPPTNFLKGYIQDFRIYNNHAQYDIAAGIVTTSFSNPGTTPVEISTTQSKFGNGAAYFAPTGNQTSYIQAAFTDTVAGDWTLEYWQYRTGTLQGYSGPYEWGTYSNSILNTGSTYYFSGGSGSISGSSAGFLNTLDTWEHYAIVRESSTITFYRDGVGVGTFTGQSGTFNPSNDNFRIGAPQWAGGNWAGYMNDFIFYNGVAKYTSSFTPPSSQYDFATDPNQEYVMFAATFAGTNGDTNITYNSTTNQTTVPSSALTAVGDTNYKKLSFFSNFDNGKDSEYKYYGVDELFKVNKPLYFTSYIDHGHVFDDQYVIVGTYGDIGISTDGETWTRASKRGNYDTEPGDKVGIDSHFNNSSVYFYETVGIGSTVVAIADYGGQDSSKYLFFSENGGDDSFNNLWANHHYGYSFTTPYAGGRSIGHDTKTNQTLISRNYATRSSYGSDAINISFNPPNTDAWSGNDGPYNWYDFTYSVNSIVPYSGAMTKVKWHGGRWHMIGYNAYNSNWYTAGITTSLTDINKKMKLINFTQTNINAIAYDDTNEEFVLGADVFPTRNSVVGDLVRTPNGQLSSYNVTQTQEDYYNEPSSVSISDSAKYVRVGLGTTVFVVSLSYAGTYHSPDLDTSVKKFGTGSWHFDNVGNGYQDWDGIRHVSTRINWGLSDYTYSFWFYDVSGSGYVHLMHMTQNQALNYSAGTLTFLGQNIKTGLNTGQWYHIAVTRQGSKVRLFCDGVQTNEFTNTYFELASSYGGAIGMRWDGYSINGDASINLDDIQIYRGYCGYTTDFTPPTSAHDITTDPNADKLVFASSCDERGVFYVGTNLDYATTGVQPAFYFNGWYGQNYQSQTTPDTKITGYFKPEVAGIHTFTFRAGRGGNLWFDDRIVASTFDSNTRTYTTGSLTTTTYYPIEINSYNVYNGAPIYFGYADSTTGGYNYDFSTVGFVTAGINTSGFTVKQVPYYGYQTGAEYHHPTIKAIVKGDDGYFVGGENGMAGFTTDFVAYRNFRREGYTNEGLSVGVSTTVYGIFANNDIVGGAYTDGKYVIVDDAGGIGFTTDFITWEDKKSDFANAHKRVSSASDGPIEIGITSSGNYITVSGDSFVGITTDFVTVTTKTYKKETLNDLAVSGTPTVTTGLNDPYGNAVGVGSFDNSEYIIWSNSDQVSTYGSGVDFSNSKWTVEAWIYVTSTGIKPGFQWSWLYRWFSGLTLTSNGLFIRSSAYGANREQAFGGTGVELTANAWNHVAWMRDGSQTNTYVNGIGTDTGTWSPNTTLGYARYLGESFTGKVSDLRFYSDAKYNVSSGSTFTVPTQYYSATSDPYIDTLYTVGIVSFQGANDSTDFHHIKGGYISTIRDHLTANESITAVGGIGTANIMGSNTGGLYMTDDNIGFVTTIITKTVGYEEDNAYEASYGSRPTLSSAQTKFQPTSLYFNGTTNMKVDLTNVFTLQNDFCIEWWSYYSGGETMMEYIQYNVGFMIRGNAFYGVSGGSGGSANTWNHHAIIRKNGTKYWYVNGTLAATVTYALSSTSGVLHMGSSSHTGGQYVVGYMSDLVITVGHSRYNGGDSSITIPSAAYDPSTDAYADYVVHYSTFTETDAITGYPTYSTGKDTVYNPNPFNKQRINKIVGVGSNIIGISSNGYYAYANQDDLNTWYSGRLGTNDLKGIVSNGISTDIKIGIVNDSGSLYFSE